MVRTNFSIFLVTRVTGDESYTLIGSLKRISSNDTGAFLKGPRISTRSTQNCHTIKLDHSENRHQVHCFLSRRPHAAAYALTSLGVIEKKMLVLRKKHTMSTQGFIIKVNKSAQKLDRLSCLSVHALIELISENNDE